MSVKLKCQWRWSVSEDKVSVKLKCRWSWSVSEVEVLVKMKCEDEVSEKEVSKVEVWSVSNKWSVWIWSK